MLARLKVEKNRPPDPIAARFLVGRRKGARPDIEIRWFFLEGIRVIDGLRRWTEFS
jgi:hypothetical protein